MAEPLARRKIFAVLAIVLAVALIAAVWLWWGGPGAKDSATPNDASAAMTSGEDSTATTSPSALQSPRPPGSPQSPSAAVPSSPGDSSDAAPVGTVDAGVKLERLESPPERSLWALSPDSYDTGAEVTVRFETYGLGPESLGASVVTRVTEATPADSSARLPDLSGRNVIFIIGETTVETGGAWEATAVTRLSGDRIVFVLTEARPATGG